MLLSSLRRAARSTPPRLAAALLTALLTAIALGQPTAAQSPEIGERFKQASDRFLARDCPAAVGLYRQLLVALPPDDDSLRPTAEEQLGQCLLALGQDEEGGKLLEALAAKQKLNPGYGFEPALARAALAAFRRKQFDRAEALLSEVIASWEKLRDQPDLGELAKITLVEQQGYVYRLMLRVLVAQGKTEEALVWLERLRGRSLLELVVSQASGQAVAEAPTLAALKQVARDRNITIVSYANLGNEARIFGDEPEADDVVGIWVLSPDGRVSFKQVSLAEIPELGSTSLVTAAQALRGSVTAAINGNPGPRLKAFDRLLIAPIADRLDARRTLVLVPQGPLFQVPFAALQDSEGRSLIARQTIAVVPSIQVLGALGKSTGAVGGPALVAGNPVSMPTLPASGTRAAEALAPLPGAESEAEVIGRLLNTPPLLKAAASKAAILQDLAGKHLLHFATHGILDLDANLNEFGLARQADAPTARQSGVVVNAGRVIIGANSGGNSVRIGGTEAGVSLANQRVVVPTVPGMLAFAPSGGDDGLWRSTEIARLSLSARLVVLSACNTGRGRVANDGVIGLARSFMVAGVPTVVASLWKVPDEPTKDLMVAFYGHLKENKSAALSLQQAMLEMQQKYPNPRDWASFVVTGSPD